MLKWLAIPAVLSAAIVALCYAYMVSPIHPVELNRRLPPTIADLTIRPDPRTSAIIDPPAEDHAIVAFQRAAEAILKRAPNAQASASADKPPIAGHIPLPKRRPIPRL